MYSTTPPVDHFCYKSNSINKIIKTSKNSYYVNFFNNFRSKTTRLWKELNNITKPKASKQKINIMHKDKLLTKPLDVANSFNTFFSEIASHLDSNLPQAQHNPMDLLTGDFTDPMMVPNVHFTDILKIIKGLKSKQSNTDDFSPMIIKDNAHLIAQPLATLFNQSIMLGKFPSTLKIARITPIFKKGSKTDMNNYRPISILNVFSKIFEKQMKVFLMAHITKNNVLFRDQYGFQAGKSTIDAHIKFSTHVHNQLNQSNCVLSIFVDFSKAFDTVPHDLLLNKLAFYGIVGKANDWFRDYLADRSHVTSIDDQKSDPARVRLGVPQGSVLGPVLFLLFINDLPNFSKIFHTILFADDAKLSLSGKNPVHLINMANSELTLLYYWCIANRISINTLKTVFMLFSNRPITQLPPVVMKFNYTYEIIKRVESTKFLGIFYDERMSFKCHINYLCQRLSRISSLIYRLKDMLPTFVLKTLYHAHISSILSYCTVIWSGATPTSLTPLIRLQKRIIRNITVSDFLAHTAPLFQQCRILNIENVLKLALGSYFYSNFIHDLAPFQANHDHNTRHRLRLRPPHHNTSLFERSFVVQAPKFWNTITDSYPPEILSSNNIKIFNKRLKSYLLQ